MKRALAVLLIIVIMLSLSACSSNSGKLCHQCEEYYFQDAKYCPNCGADLNANDWLEAGSEPVDYSDFGFQNNYGMTEWMEIDDYDFSDPQNAYVTCVEWNSKFYIMKFEDGYLHTRKFTCYSEQSDFYKDNFTVGELTDLYQYSVISNDLISLPDNSSYEIKYRVLENNIPIVSISLNYEEYFNDYTIKNGRFIPKDFIDFSREPEIYKEKIPSALASTSKIHIKYYIKSSYIK